MPAPFSYPANDNTMGTYVAELQLHMTLQARSLVPDLSNTAQTPRDQLLQQTQAAQEIAFSRLR